MSRIRAFVALDLPAEAAAAVAAWQAEALKGREGLRAIRPEALHLTLAFLGDRDEGEIAAAIAVLEGHGAEPAPVPIRLEPVPIGLPRRRPRVVAFEAVSAAAVQLQEALAADLVAAGVLAPERRAFRPHLSVARVRGDPRRMRPRPSIGTLPPLSGGGGHTFDAVRVALYRSQLGSQGARYGCLGRVRLAADSGGRGDLNMAASKPTPIEAGSKDAKAKDAALKAAVTQIEREFGAGSVMKLGSDTVMDVEAIPTGALSLDLALGVGGVPKGRIVEIFGPRPPGRRR